MIYNIYDLSKIAFPDDTHTDIQVAIVNNNKVILSNNDACHTIHNFDDVVMGLAEIMGSTEITAKQIIDSTPIGTTDNIGSWIRTFGNHFISTNRIERNYDLLLKSIKEIGLNPKDFPL